MTNKRFDWMTPEEAAKELKPGEFVWLLWNSCIEPGVLVYRTLDSSIACVLTDSNYTYCLSRFDRICRAIVPEVPGE